MYELFWFCFAIFVIIKCYEYYEYRKSNYYQVTKCSYFSVLFDAGRLGEYLTYKYLRKYEQEGAKFLFNIYVPKEENETSEIDVLMISSKGLFVFESKNYSGWIFGSENQRNWYQTLPAGRRKSHKEVFYNPIMQNRSHIKHLKTFLDKEYPMHSIIVFSERCTLKNVDIKSNDITVIKRDDIKYAIDNIFKQLPDDLVGKQEIDDIYMKLYALTQVGQAVKEQHVENIHNNLNRISPEIKVDVDVVKNQRIDSDLCPKCGGNLVLRTATKGDNKGKQFYGCSKFPKCRYMKNIKIEIE